MDDDGGLGIRNWGYYEQPLKGNLGLHLMPSVAERDTKPLLTHGGFFLRDCGVPEPSTHTDIMRDSWIHHWRENDNKFLHMVPLNNHHHLSHFGTLPDPPTAHTVQMLQHPEPAKDNNFPVVEETANTNVSEAPLKKRARGRPQKSPKALKPKKPRKVAKSSDEAGTTSISQRKPSKKSEGMIVNGVKVDISGIPTPVCSCTGKLQPCYRWGAGGWQSACCTTSISMYPLPMNTKRRGARIAGRKMSQGAFRKVLEKLTEEGHSLSNPIDLKLFWAKHGTNKFVTISIQISKYTERDAVKDDRFLPPIYFTERESDEPEHIQSGDRLGM